MNIFETHAQSYAHATNFFWQRIWEIVWLYTGFLGKISSKNKLFSNFFAYLESAWRADWKNGLIFSIWWILIFGHFGLDYPKSNFSPWSNQWSEMSQDILLSIFIHFEHIFSVLSPDHYKSSPLCIVISHDCVDDYFSYFSKCDSMTHVFNNILVETGQET